MQGCIGAKSEPDTHKAFHKRQFPSIAEQAAIISNEHDLVDFLGY